MGNQKIERYLGFDERRIRRAKKELVGVFCDKVGNRFQIRPEHLKKQQGLDVPLSVLSFHKQFPELFGRQFNFNKALTISQLYHFPEPAAVNFSVNNVWGKLGLDRKSFARNRDALLAANAIIQTDEGLSLSAQVHGLIDGQYQRFDSGNVSHVNFRESKAPETEEKNDAHLYPPDRSNIPAPSGQTYPRIKKEIIKNPIESAERNGGEVFSSLDSDRGMSVVVKPNLETLEHEWLEAVKNLYPETGFRFIGWSVKQKSMVRAFTKKSAIPENELPEFFSHVASKWPRIMKTYYKWVTDHRSADPDIGFLLAKPEGFIAAFNSRASISLSIIAKRNAIAREQVDSLPSKKTFKTNKAAFEWMIRNPASVKVTSPEFINLPPKYKFQVSQAIRRSIRHGYKKPEKTLLRPLTQAEIDAALQPFEFIPWEQQKEM